MAMTRESIRGSGEPYCLFSCWIVIIPKEICSSFGSSGCHDRNPIQVLEQSKKKKRTGSSCCTLLCLEVVYCLVLSVIYENIIVISTKELMIKKPISAIQILHSN